MTWETIKKQLKDNSVVIVASIAASVAIGLTAWCIYTRVKKICPKCGAWVIPFGENCPYCGASLEVNDGTKTAD